MMIRIPLLLIALLSAHGFASPAPTTKPTPVAAVAYITGYPPPGSKLTNGLITGVWSDGTVITSANREIGGPPYTSRKLDAARLKQLAADLDALKFFTDEEINKQPYHYPPDASYTVVGASFADKRQRIGLWRAPTTQPADADHFVQVFMKARELINKLGDSDAKGEPVDEIDKAIFNVGEKPR